MLSKAQDIDLREEINIKNRSSEVQLKNLDS